MYTTGIVVRILRIAPLLAHTMRSMHKENAPAYSFQWMDSELVLPAYPGLIELGSAVPAAPGPRCVTSLAFPPAGVVWTPTRHDPGLLLSLIVCTVKLFYFYGHG